MTKYDKLRENLFDVNPMACREVANVLRAYEPKAVASPPDGEIEGVLGFQLALVAICHDINWNFLQVKLKEFVDRDPGTALHERLSRVRRPQMEALLQGYEHPHRIQAEARCATLREVGNVLKSEFQGAALNLYVRSNRRLGGGAGFLEQLDKFPCFGADPLRKKSNILVQEVVRSRTLSFVDEAQMIEPGIDYHIQRLYLRTTRVVCTDSEFVEDLRAHRPGARPRFVKLLRARVSDAMKLTAFYAGLKIPDVNNIEWQLARAVCVKDLPFCRRDERPTGLDPDVASLFAGSCPFAGFCPGRIRDDVLELKEPNFKTSFY